MGVNGISDFDALHFGKQDDQVQFCAFDILVDSDDDLRKLPLSMPKNNPEQRIFGRLQFGKGLPRNLAGRATVQDGTVQSDCSGRHSCLVVRDQSNGNVRKTDA